MHLFSQSLSIVLWFGSQLLNVTFNFSSVRYIRWPGSHLIRVSCRCFIDVMLLGSVWCTRLIRTRITDCSVSNVCSVIPSASTSVRHPLTAAAAHPLEFEVSGCRTSQFARRFMQAQIGLWNDLPYTVFGTGTLDRFKGTVNCWFLSSLRWL